MELREPTSQEREQIEAFLALDEDELIEKILEYQTLPATIIHNVSTIIGILRGGMSGMTEVPDIPPPTLLEKTLDKLAKILCEDWELCRRIDNPALNDSLNLVIAITDVLAVVQLKIPAPPTLLASLVVKIGVRNFCKCK